MDVYIEILVISKFIVSKSQDCHVLPEMSQSHVGQQNIIILMSDFVVRTAVMTLRHFTLSDVNRHKENKGATCLLHPNG
jgi:hypothetical protein